MRKQLYYMVANIFQNIENCQQHYKVHDLQRSLSQPCTAPSKKSLSSFRVSGRDLPIYTAELQMYSYNRSSKY